MENAMTYGFAGMFAAFILTSTILPTWLLAIPAALVISSLTLAHRENK